ncbi:MAG TPA: hypothetical protein VMZ91_08525 [Candidatus Paceibacterota bacterium]|nr:hypothetical protein [Candidatus Paceibacterota bacterium]
MDINSENTIYDSQQRIVKNFEPVSGLLFEYEYLENTRTTTITHEKNKSNFKTIKKEILFNGNYVDLETEQYGDTYYTFHKYNNKGEEVFFKQINLKTNKILKKITVWKNNKPFMWTTDYDGEKGIGFYVSENILNELIKNK